MYNFKSTLRHLLPFFTILLLFNIACYFTPSYAFITTLEPSDDKSSYKPHPLIHGNTHDFFKKAARVFEEEGGIVDTSEEEQRGITVVFENKTSKTSGLVVVKKNGPERRVEKEAYLYALSRLAGLECIVPTYTYKGQALEVLAKFFPDPKSNSIPDDVHTFYKNFANGYGVITLSSLIAGITDSNRKYTRETLHKRLDRQSLQELSLARSLFCLGDLYARNIVLSWNKGRIRMYTFDTGGCVRNGVLFADSMGAHPNGNGVLDLCFSDILSNPSRTIIARWSALKKIKGLRSDIEHLWPVEANSSVSYAPRQKTSFIGPTRSKPSAYMRFMNRIGQLQAFAKSNSKMTLGELDFALTGISYFSPSGMKLDLFKAFSLSQLDEHPLRTHGLAAALSESGVASKEFVEHEKEVKELNKCIEYALPALGKPPSRRSERLIGIKEYLVKYPTNSKRKKALARIQRLFPPQQINSGVFDWGSCPVNKQKESVFAVQETFPLHLTYAHEDAVESYSDSVKQ